jgi:hypothetical protein
MTRQSSSAIERVKFLKEVNAYKKLGFTISKLCNIFEIKHKNKFVFIWNAFEAIDNNMAQIEIVDNLTKNEIEKAVLAYCRGKEWNEIIDGTTKGELTTLYFTELHISKEHKKCRKNTMRFIKENQLDCAPIIEPIPEPVKKIEKELWDFSDDNIIETKRPALVQFHSKSSGLGYGCAANMCAEK